MKKSLIDLLNFLSYDEKSRFLPQSKHFEYKRIDKIQVEVEVEKSDKVDFTPEYDPNGYSFEYITFNRSRANVSLRVRYDGTAKLPLNDFGMKAVSTYIYRAYVIIRDGVPNIDFLPVIASDSLLEFLIENDIKFSKDMDYESINVINIDLKSVPVVSESEPLMITAGRLSLLEVELFHLQAMRKYTKSLFDENSGGGAFTQGVEIENWLKSIGITSSHGYVQQTEELDTGDEDSYEASALKTKISSLSNLPTLSSVKKKLDGGKNLTPSESILHQSGIVFEELLANDLKGIENETAYKSARKALISERYNEIESRIKGKLFQISQIVFFVITKNTWFEDKKDFEDNQLEVDLNGNKHTVTFEYKNIEIKI